MDDPSRRWVLQSLSPPLHPRDLRSTTGLSAGQDDFSGARPVIVSPDGCDKRYPDSPGGSSGSRDGFYSFVEDPTSRQAELNEAWMLSPQRQAHLRTLKEDGPFKVQTYASGKRTESLFADSDSRYRVQPESRRHVFGAEEEKQLRKEIIRKQAPKRTSTFQRSERLDALQQPDWSRPTKGFGVSSGPVTPEAPCPVDPGAIDGAQINFGAARQQFLDLERAMWDVLVRPWRPGPPPPSSGTMEGEEAAGSESGKVETFADNERAPGPGGVPGHLGSLAAQHSRVEVCPRSIGGEDVCDDGVVHASGKAESDDRDQTPIEKEIRLLREREENLRREPGLKHSDGFSELVGIQSGRVQSLPSPREAQKKSHGSVVAVQLQSREKDVSAKAPEELSDADEQLREDPRDREQFLSPCCPHRHAEETSSTPNAPAAPRHVPSWTASLWRSDRESAGLECGEKSATDFMEKEIEEALQRERELQESRRSRESSESGESRERRGCGQSAESGLRSATPLVGRASAVTATPLDPIQHSGPTGAPPRDSEERRGRRKYAGIRPGDHINDQVVESTRVIRHKSRRALRWEAGVFANRLQH